MLVLKRKLGEKLIINGKICVQVVEIHGNQVRLGVTAPAEVLILREELLSEESATSTISEDCRRMRRIRKVGPAQ
jgi:carbon storage regulator